jgi:hypothetical protein
MPTSTPSSWWECDMLSLTKAGFWHEFEIKMTRSDFKADFKKSSRYPYQMHGMSYREYYDLSREDMDNLEDTKHGFLANGCKKGPSYFWFCTPAGLLKPEDIPEYAGHIEFPDLSDLLGKPSPYRYDVMDIKKKAPKLHSVKFCDKRLKTLTGRMLYRYQQLYFHGKHDTEEES